MLARAVKRGPTRLVFCDNKAAALPSHSLLFSRSIMARSPTDPMVIGAAVTALLLVAAAVFFMKKKKGKAGKAARRPLARRHPSRARRAQLRPSRRSRRRRSRRRSRRRRRRTSSSSRRPAKSPSRRRQASAPRRSRHRHRVRAALCGPYVGLGGRARERALYGPTGGRDKKRGVLCERATKRSGETRRVMAGGS